MELYPGFVSIEENPGFRLSFLKRSERIELDIDELMPHYVTGKLPGGLRAFVELCLMSRLWQGSGSCELKGLDKTSAHTLYKAFDEARNNWLAAFIGPDMAKTEKRGHEDEERRKRLKSFNQCLQRHRDSHEDEDRKWFEYRVWLVQPPPDEKLPPVPMSPDSIHVWLDGKWIRDLQTIERIADGFGIKVPRPSQKLCLRILRSGELNYTQEIRNGLTTKLASLGYEVNSLSG